MAEWWEDPNIAWEAQPDRGPGSVNDWFNQPAATGQRFAIDPSVTQEQLDALPEMTDSNRIIEGFSVEGEGEQGAIRGTLSRMGTEASQAWLNMTMTDPMELGSQLQNRYPGLIDVRLAPNPSEDPEDVEAYPLIPIARNTATGYEAVINRPGLSGQDVLQTIGLIGQYAPATRAVGAVKSLIPRAVAAVSAYGGTEALAQTGQAAAGGEFDPEDVALAAAFGLAPELLAKPAIGLAMKGKELVGRVADVVPNTVRQALEFARQRGLTITTADALAERLTPPQQIFLKITERIPVFGTQAIKNRQMAQRADALSEVADEFGVDIETDLGQEIAENWVSRMRNWRFFGRNQNPTDEMVNRAFKREGADVIDSTLGRRIANATVENGQIDDVLVDQVFKSNNAVRVRDMFQKLTPDGQQAARTRFMTEGLNRAGWRPGQQTGIASPATFVKYLDDHANSLKEIFPDEAQLTYVNGLREFLRITNQADKAAAGAGMTAALAAGGGFYLFDIMGGAIAGMGTGLLGRAVQSAPARNLFLRLAHAEGNPALTNSIMRELRPLILATGNQVLQGEVDMPQLSMAMSPEMIEEGAATGLGASMQILRGVTEAVNPYALLGGTASEEGSLGGGSAVVGPGLGALQRFTEAGPQLEPEE
jgi:hypothetical protein